MHDITSICTIQEFFKNTLPIRIPDYQRAYCWDNKQCKQFLYDLLGQAGQEGMYYYLGQFLFEKDNETLMVVDGQQRLTTIILFIASVMKILNSRKSNPKDFASLNVKVLRETKEIYLSGVFNTIDNDQYIFNKIIQGQLSSNGLRNKTTSQQRIIQAFSFFNDELCKLESLILYALLWTLEHATKINTMILYNTKQAAQIFRYQNNRGNNYCPYEIMNVHPVKQKNQQRPHDDQKFFFQISLS
jgi:uncharacterized protein with ParB-like and HNH nuclease domain